MNNTKTIFGLVLRISGLRASNEAYIKPLCDAFEEMMATALTAREVKILKWSYGINTDSMTAYQIGQEFDLCKERISQLKEKAIRKLKKQGLSPEIERLIGNSRTFVDIFKQESITKTK